MADRLRDWHLQHRMTRRRAFLHLVSLHWLAQGIWVATVSADIFSRPGPGPLDWMESGWWSALWLVSAVVTFWVSLDRRVSDVVGFSTLIAPAILWSSFGFYSLGVAAATNEAFGEYSAWRIGVVWGLLAATVRLIANWEEPTEQGSPLPPPLLIHEVDRE